ncbi:MAG: hypothetical protein HY722_00135 [Planctomycetes bacterium]|nr:hypothetical protein [Planctomycetota bacterium]
MSAPGVPLRRMPPEARELGQAWRSRVGEIRDLTSELESEFRFGQKVIFFNGLYRLGGNIKGGSSAMWHVASEAQFHTYTAWAALEGIATVEDRRAFDGLQALLARHGVRIRNGSHGRSAEAEPAYNRRHGVIYDLTARVLGELPASHLSRDSFRSLQLGGWGPDGAKGSAYEDRTVMMYDFALSGARRTYLGLLLHELGHAHEHALEPWRREPLGRAFEPIAREGAVIGVEFLLDATARQVYQRSFLNEFLAETYMIYTSQGQRLREFIAGQPPRPRSAWEVVYHHFRETFDGTEYE